MRKVSAPADGKGSAPLDSDRPAGPADHSYARHVAWVYALAFQALDLTGVTLVGQDWGGLIGLRLVAEHPQRSARVVATNMGLPTWACRPAPRMRPPPGQRLHPYCAVSRL